MITPDIREDRRRRVLAGLMLGGTALGVVLLPPTVFVIAVVVVALIGLSCLAWHLYEDRASIWSENVDLATKVKALEAKVGPLVPDASRARLELEIDRLVADNLDLQGRLADAEMEITALRMEAGRREHIAPVVQIHEAPSTRGGAS